MNAPGSDAIGMAEPAPNPGQPQASRDIGARRSPARILKDIGLFFAAPFITLAYLPLFPFIGLAELRQAWRHRKDAT